MSLPPGTFHPPFVGSSIPLTYQPLEYLNKMVPRYGPVFKTRYFFKKSVVLVGAEAHKLALVGDPGNFLNKEGYDFVAPFFGGTLIMTDGAEHDNHRRLMTPAFHGRNMGSYLDIINRIIDQGFTRWSTRGQVAFRDEAAKMTFALASAILVGVEEGRDLAFLEKQWHDFALGPNGIITLNLPTTVYGRGLRAKARINAMLQRLVNERRTNPSAPSSVLSMLIAARDEDGQVLSDAQILDQMRLMLFAGFDTTTGTLSWVMVELLQHPEVLARLLEEIHADDHDRAVSVEDLSLKHRPYLEAVINETLRLHPQVPVFMRGVKEGFHFGGYDIPAGWAAILPAVYTHRMPEYFTDPERFDPDRFLPPREEHKATPYAWIGFGGGPHQCLGEGVARIEMKAILTRLLWHYDLKLLPGQDFTPLYLPLSRPKSDVQVTYFNRN